MDTNTHNYSVNQINIKAMEITKEKKIRNNHLMQFVYNQAEHGYRCTLHGKPSVEASVQFISDAIDYLENLKNRNDNHQTIRP